MALCLACVHRSMRMCIPPVYYFVLWFRVYQFYITASRNRPPQPPAYTPPQGPFYQAPPPAYSAPHTEYYAWVPYQTFPTAPPRKLGCYSCGIVIYAEYKGFAHF